MRSHATGFTGRTRAALSLKALVLALALLSILPASAVGESAHTARLPVLTTVGAVHLLSFKEAARAYPVHLRAVITYYDPFLNHPRRPIIMVTDRTGSIYVGIAGETDMPLKPGVVVEVNGESDPGDFGPNISHATVRIVGHAPLPPHPPRVSMTHLLTGSEDAQWVEMEGVVKSFEIVGGNVTLKLALADGEMAATTVREPGADYARLVDARVVIHGIAGSLFNLRAQLIGLQLLFPGLSTLRIEQPAPEHPFQLPVLPIASLMQYAPGRVFPHRVHMRGAVTLFWPGRLLCIQTGSDALCAATGQTDPLVPGELIDVIGFPMIGNVTPTLSDAAYQASPGQRPQPVPPAVIDANQAFGGLHDAQMVQMEGRLIAHDRASPDPTIVVSSGKFNFPVILPQSANAASLLALKDGSILRINGILSVQADPRVFTRHDGYPVARYFQVMLRSGADVTVLKTPSWWTAEHTLRLLAGVLALALAALCWSLYLRVRIRQQTELLRFQATHDGLTGLWNRKAVLDLLRREIEIAARTRQCIGVMMLDADYFKKVNDVCGHLAGDAVLKEIARRIQRSVRSYDLTGRYGGEEFLIVLPRCTGEELQSCAERVRVAVADAPVLAEGSSLSVTVSVGTAVLDPLRYTEREALEAADNALYEAKRTGRNRVVSAHLKSPLMA